MAVVAPRVAPVVFGVRDGVPQFAEEIRGEGFGIGVVFLGVGAFHLSVSGTVSLLVSFGQTLSDSLFARAFKEDVEVRFITGDRSRREGGLFHVAPRDGETIEKRIGIGAGDLAHDKRIHDLHGRDLDGVGIVEGGKVKDFFLKGCDEVLVVSAELRFFVSGSAALVSVNLDVGAEAKGHGVLFPAFHSSQHRGRGEGATCYENRGLSWFLPILLTI